MAEKLTVVVFAFFQGELPCARFDGGQGVPVVGQRGRQFRLGPFHVFDVMLQGGDDAPENGDVLRGGGGSPLFSNQATDQSLLAVGPLNGLGQFGHAADESAVGINSRSGDGRVFASHGQGRGRILADAGGM